MQDVEYCKPTSNTHTSLPLFKEIPLLVGFNQINILYSKYPMTDKRKKFGLHSWKNGTGEAVES